MNDDLKAIEWRGRSLGLAEAMMYYHGRLRIDPIRGYASLEDLEGSPDLDDVLRSGEYDVEIRVLRRLSK